jgi:hypothetical protein
MGRTGLEAAGAILMKLDMRKTVGRRVKGEMDKKAMI